MQSLPEDCEARLDMQVFYVDPHWALSPKRMLRKSKHEQWRRVPVAMRPNGPMKLVCLLSEASFRCFWKKKKNRQELGQWKASYQRKIWCVTRPSVSQLCQGFGPPGQALTGTVILNYVAWQTFSLSEYQFWPSIYQSQAVSTDCFFPPFRKKLWNCERKLNYSD